MGAALLHRMRSGDVANWLALFATAGFFLAVVANELHYLQVFSTAWSADGFCISNKDLDPLLQSHAMCFYGDTVAAVLLWFTLRYSRQQGVAQRIVETLEPGVFGIFAHGCAHLWMGMRPELMQRERTPVGEMPVQKLFTVGGGLFLFWFFLLRSINKNISNRVWALLACAFTATQVLFVSPKFGFTFVHVGLMTVATAVALKRADKDQYYDLEGWVINLPITMMAWLEAATCETFLVHIGGHFWYDIEIPLSMFLFWWLAIRSVPTKESEKLE